MKMWVYFKGEATSKSLENMSCTAFPLSDLEIASPFFRKK